MTKGVDDMTINFDKEKIDQWAQELERLASEIKQRLDEENFVQVLSSLAAIPPLHQTLIENCLAASKDDETKDLDETPIGLYL